MQLEDWKRKGTYFNYNTHQIFNVEEGEGDPILLIHGFPTSSWDWSQMWSRLTDRYKVLALDMIGFGYSDKPRNYNYRITDQADLVEALLRSKNILQVKLLTHDYGDTVAQELLARFNDRQSNNEEGLIIESLCLLNGGLFPETHKALLIQKILMSPLGSIVSRLFNRKKLGDNFKKIFGPDTQPTEQELDEYWSIISYKDGNYISHLLIKYMQDRIDNRERWVTALQNANIPIRVIDGIYDPISGQHMVDRYRELIPSPDVIELDRIGHFPLIEAPDSVLKHYLDFISKDEPAV